MSPRFIIIGVVVVVIVVNVIRLGIKSSTHHFVCPECGEHFQVSFSKYFFTAHSLGGGCNVTCPKCGRKNMLTAQKGKI